MFFLGTPHHGAPLERGGHWIDRLLGASPYTAAFSRLGKLRSAGITDLRHGSLLDEDWMGSDRFAHGHDTRTPVPLPAGVACYAMAGVLGRGNGELSDQLLGDGLVPLDSALGRHRQAARTLAFDAGRQWVGQGLGHLDLLGHADVGAQLRAWMLAPQDADTAPAPRLTPRAVKADQAASAGTAASVAADSAGGASSPAATVSASSSPERQAASTLPPSK